MAEDSKSSAELQREIEAHRHKMENKIDEIQARLSPGQLIDEVLSYGKGGGSAFVSNLGDTVSRNPLPIALLGVSLAWLIAGPRSAGGYAGPSPETRRADWQRYYMPAVDAPGVSTYNAYRDLPLATVKGPLQRLGHVRDDTGKNYSEFVDEAGKKFRALTDEGGHRAGHFMDETGKSFRGFIDEAGSRIEQFQDEAGNLIDDAANWASHTFRIAGEALDGTRRSVGDQAGAIGQQAQHLTNEAGHIAMYAGNELQHRADRMMRQAGTLLQQQPLIGGAFAFALGAAVGAMLPRSEQEDRLIGDTADGVKASLGHEVTKFYEEGKEQVAHAYEEARDKAGELLAEAKDSVIGLVDKER